MVCGDSHDGCVGAPCPELTNEVILCAPGTDQEESDPGLHPITLSAGFFLTWKDGKETSIHAFGRTIVIVCILTSVLALLMR